MYRTLLFVLICISTYLNSQEKQKPIILLKETHSANPSIENYLEVSECDSTYLLTFSYLQCRDKSSLTRKDKKQQKKLAKLYLKETDRNKLAEYAAQMSKYLDKEKVFTTEKVMVCKTNNSDFSEKVNAILMVDKPLLETDIRKGTNITLDGKWLQLEVYPDSKIEKTVCIYGASAESHPIIYSFYRHAKDIRNDNR